MNILSLFDGMSCGQQALERAGVKVDQYFASEIDKFAIKVTMANYPNTIQLGSVINVNGYDLPKIDLLIGGSPCQSFSFAGKRKGMATKDEIEIYTLEHYLQLKNDGYEFEGQSYLFWEYMRILNEVKPKYFLLENVMMGEKWERILSRAIGVNPIEINSALVSAQNRRRLYWTNIGMKAAGLFGDLESIIEQPKDKGILLKDVLECEVDEKYFLSEKMNKWLVNHSNKKQSQGCGYKFEPTYGNKKSKILATRPGTQIDDNYIIHNTMPRSSITGKGGTGHLSRNDGKTYCLDTGNTNAVEIVAMRGRNPENPKSRVSGQHTEQQLEPRNDGKTNCLTSVQKDNLVQYLPADYRSDEGLRIRSNGKAPTLTRGAETSGTQYNSLVVQLNLSTESGGKQPFQQNRIYDENEISLALFANKSDLIINTTRIRRLTPTECERLQTVKDNYTNFVSDSQRYKMLGNGWTVDVISHIFKYLS